MHLVSLSILATLAAALPGSDFARSSKRSNPPSVVQGRYVIEDGTSFANSATYTFSSGALPSGLKPGIETVGQRTYTQGNIQFQDGYLTLVVPGGQTVTPYTGGMIETEISNILHASVRTTAILPATQGVCSGFFFYKSDSQEIDTEWLSDPASQSNAGTPQVFLTNHGDGTKTYKGVVPPSDATTTEHEYRVDWTDGQTQWFIDGQVVFTATDNVPSQPGTWLWNNWSDGDIQWSAGPPASDAVLKIKQIEMYYDTA